MDSLEHNFSGRPGAILADSPMQNDPISKRQYFPTKKLNRHTPVAPSKLPQLFCEVQNPATYTNNNHKEKGW